MPGPIVRSGPTTQYQNNWDAAFGEAKNGSRKNSATKSAKKKTTRKKK